MIRVDAGNRLLKKRKVVIPTKETTTYSYIILVLIYSNFYFTISFLTLPSLYFTMFKPLVGVVRRWPQALLHDFRKGN